MQVWEAIDTHTGSRVAVKKMSVTADDYSSDGFPISALREVTYPVACLLIGGDESSKG